MKWFYTEAVAQRCSGEKEFLEIWQSLQENTCDKFLNQILRTSFLIEHFRWLLLSIAKNFLESCQTSMMGFLAKIVSRIREFFFTSNAALNPYVPNAPFLYPLKTSENITVSCFQEVGNGYIGNKWAIVKTFFLHLPDFQ